METLRKLHTVQNNITKQLEDIEYLDTFGDMLKLEYLTSTKKFLELKAKLAEPEIFEVFNIILLIYQLHVNILGLDSVMDKLVGKTATMVLDDSIMVEDYLQTTTLNDYEKELYCIVLIMDGIVQ